MARDDVGQSQAPVWLDAEAGDFEVFKAQVAREAVAEDYPLAAEISQNVPIYTGDLVQARAGDTAARRELMSEWVRVLGEGPGVIVIRDAMEDLAVVDEATDIFSRIIEEEKAGAGGGGDHFAKPGANDRIWNAVQKHCLAAPENFAAYYASDALAMASEAWLGRGYQMTAQVNRVNPGGAAQSPHRDYHLGFMSPEQMSAYPAHIHRVSPVLTLQGGVAHCDMPLESGPTVFLPFSQTFFEGYLAFSRPEFQAYFADHHVQLPLNKGDAIFFNPALMHGAGENKTTNTYRMANLLQVSSAFGRAMEALDRTTMCKVLYPVLQSGPLSEQARDNVIAATAEGYAFPTSLDSDPPIGGLAPASQADLMRAALSTGTSEADFAAEMDAWEARRRA